MKLKRQIAITLLVTFFVFQPVFAQENTLMVRSEGGGDTREQAITNALIKAVSSQIDALIRLRAGRLTELRLKFKNKVDEFVVDYKVVQASDRDGVHRVILDVEIDIAALVKDFVKVNIAQNFRYKPRVMIAIVENELGEESDDRTFATELANLLMKAGFKVISQESVGEVREELIKGVNPERLAEIAHSHKADVLIGGNVDTKAGKKSRLLKNSDLGTYVIDGSIRAVHCATGDLYFSETFTRNQPGTLLEKARQMALRAKGPRGLLSPINPKGLAKPLLTEILKSWAVQVAVAGQRSAPDTEASAPPTLKMIAPENLAVTEQEAIRLRAVATDDNGIEGIKLWVNGVDIAVKDGEHIVSTADSGDEENRKDIEGIDANEGDSEYQISRMIALVHGENRIRLVAYDSDANQATQELTIIRDISESSTAEETLADIQVTILTPSNESVVSLPFMQLSGEAKGKDRIVDVKVFVNQTELPMARDINLVPKRKTNANQEPPYKIDRRVPLEMGRNLIKLVATTASGKTAEKHIVVSRLETENQLSEATFQPDKPQVTIYAPKNDLKTTEASIQMRGEVFSENLSTVIVSLNGSDLIHESALPSGSNNTFPVQKEIELAIGENKIRVYAETTSGEKIDETYTVTRIASESSPPFIIELDAPTPGETVAQESIRVVGSVSAQTAVNDVEVLANGIKTRSFEVVPIEGEPYKIDQRLELAPGENKITVIAKGENGQQTTYEFSVHRVLDSDQKVEAEAPDGYEKYAVIIGVGEYQDPNIPDLNYAIVDAEAIYQKLIDPKVGGFPEKNVKRLYDDQATLKNINVTLSQWLLEVVKANDMVFLYYSGHGGVAPDETGEEPDGRRKYILPHDTEAENLDTTALRNSDLSLMLDRISANKFVFVMDCCFSGGQVKDGTLKSVSPPKTRISTDVYGQLSAAGRIVISASQPDQVSLEAANLGHGVFTYHFLEALDGKADLDTNSVIELLETYMYVQREVVITSSKFGLLQQPKLMGNISGSIILSKLAN